MSQSICQLNDVLDTRRPRQPY